MSTDPRPDDIDLLPAVVAIARDEYPDLDTDAVTARVQALAGSLRQQVGADAPLPERLRALNHFLFVEQGFSGNHAEFYDPRNSYLNDVLERRLGIPISLAVLQIACAKALDIDLEGVSFPGHFLVRVPMEGGLLVMDPYHHGRSVGIEELRQRARPHFGDRDVDDQQLAQMLAPASNRAIVARMLRNLKGIYAQQQNWEKALRCADRLITQGLAQPEDHRDRGMFYLHVGLGPRAVEDLGHYLTHASDAGDAQEVRDALVEAASLRVRLQ